MSLRRNFNDLDESMNSEQYSYSHLHFVQSERVIRSLALYDMILWPLIPLPSFLFPQALRPVHCSPPWEHPLRVNVSLLIMTYSLTLRHIDT